MYPSPKVSFSADGICNQSLKIFTSIKKRLDYFPGLIYLSAVEFPFIDLSLSTKRNRLSLSLLHFNIWVCVDFLKELQVVKRDGV